MPRIAFFGFALVVSAIAGPTDQAFAAETGRAWRARSVEIDERILEITSGVSVDSLAESVRALAGFGTRNTFAEPASADKGIGGARKWILAKLEAIREASGGRLQVSEDLFQTSLPDEVAKKLELAQVEAANVVAILPGTEPASRDRLVLVGAHYDSRNEERYDVKNPAPGANDNASGVALVLELARILSPHGFEATLVFVAFSGKEQGLWGSTQFARNARKDNLGIEAVLINAAVGNVRGGGGRVDGTRVRLFSPGPPDSASRILATYVKERGECYVPGFGVSLVQRADRINRSGDQRPFQERGFAAVGLVEASENFERQDSALDKPEFVDPVYLAKVASVNAASLATLASAPPSPIKVARNWDASHYDTRIVWEREGEGVDHAGYKVLVRETSSPYWQWELDAGQESEITVKGITLDDHAMAVVAVDSSGNESLPVPVR